MWEKRTEQFAAKEERMALVGWMTLEV